MGEPSFFGQGARPKLNDTIERSTARIAGSLYDLTQSLLGGLLKQRELVSQTLITSNTQTVDMTGGQELVLVNNGTNAVKFHTGSGCSATVFTGILNAGAATGDGFGGIASITNVPCKVSFYSVAGTHSVSATLYS